MVELRAGIFRAVSLPDWDSRSGLSGICGRAGYTVCSMHGRCSMSPHFAVTFVMFKLYRFVNHANTRLDLGFLTPVISGPHWHRIHHSTFAEHYEKNFAAFFPFIDILFGSYYRPGVDEYPPTGIPAREFSGDLSEATIAPFVGLYRLSLCQIRKLTERLSKLTVSFHLVELKKAATLTLKFRERNLAPAVNITNLKLLAACALRYNGRGVSNLRRRIFLVRPS